MMEGVLGSMLFGAIRDWSELCVRFNTLLHASLTSVCEVDARLSLDACTRKFWNALVLGVCW